MKVYLKGLLFSVVVACAYFFIDVRFFSLDHLSVIRTSLFSQFNQNHLGDEISLCNTGILTDREVGEHVRRLLDAHPKAIGINGCDLNDPRLFVRMFADHPEVVVAYCPGEGRTASSSIIEEGNRVTRFTPDSGSFEVKLAGRAALSERGNESEIINFGMTGFYRDELKDMTVHEGSAEQIYLVGYLGDQISPDELYYFNHARITPLNPHFNVESVSPDSYDIEISAHIIATIRNKNFINEVPLWGRVLIMLGACLLNVGLIMLIKTRWLLLDVGIYVFIFFFLVLAASMSLVYLFTRNIYLNLNGMEVLLLVASVFTAFSTFEGKMKRG